MNPWRLTLWLLINVDLTSYAVAGADPETVEPGAQTV